MSEKKKKRKVLTTDMNFLKGDFKEARRLARIFSSCAKNRSPP